MAGDNQHFIPLHVLRGFAIRGKPKFGWVYRSGTPLEPERLKKLASDYRFYSEPGPGSLDEQITDHENDELAPNIASLRINPPGPIDGQQAAEIVVHLSMRSESTRENLTSGVRGLTARMFSVFENESAVREFIGLGGKEPGERFKDRIVAQLSKDPRVRSADIPEDALTRVAFGFAREHFSTAHRQFAPALRFKLAALHQSASELVRNSHNEALKRGLVPEGRVAALAGLAWEVIEVSENIVLPDCVAIGFDNEGNARPLLLIENSQLAVVAMALSSRRLLIGHRAGVAPFDSRLFNIHAIACSERFFVSAVLAPELSDWSRFIGIQSSTILNKELSTLFEEFISAPVNADLVRAPFFPPKELAPQPCFEINFLGCADEPTARRINEVVTSVVSELSSVIPFNRLDGVTFADNYEAALASLDRGFGSSATLKTTNEPEAVGVGMAPAVLRNGVVKGHIVLRGGIGHWLISADEGERKAGLQILVGQLAEVACIELFDTAVPGVMLKPFARYFDAARYRQVAGAWSGYFAARLGAPISPEAGERYKTLLLGALRRWAESVPRERLDYRFHADLFRLLEGTLKEASYVLKHSASLIGHLDGTNEGASVDDAVNAELDRFGLRAWFDLYAQDLRILWDQQGKWGSFEEFLALGYHAERLLWPFGIFLWPTPDGGVGVKVPLHTDAARLPGEMLKRPFQTMRVILRALRDRMAGPKAPTTANVPPTS